MCGTFNFIKTAKCFPGGCTTLFDLYKVELVIFEKQVFYIFIKSNLSGYFSSIDKPV